MTQVMTYPVEWVHEEWQVKTNGQWVSAMKYVKLFSGDDSDNDDDICNFGVGKLIDSGAFLFQCTEVREVTCVH
ncbi:hypothetical protein R1flu_028858 [Riccia fluitans]|uniref:Uncharacterized protein n=1 Tax=Riccia fluitans TaxID=41844 RepID=A0ABD1XNF8_9MARC